MRHLTVLLLLLLAACGAQDPKSRALQEDLERMNREIKQVEGTIAAARTEREQLTTKLDAAALGFSEKLRRHVGGQDQIYLELGADQVVDTVRGFFEGLSGSGTQGGVPYTWTLSEVRGRSHRDRIFLNASYTMTLGGKSCSGPTAGYLLYLDRELLKLQELPVTCTTPQGAIELVLGDKLAPMPLPIAVQRKAELKTAPQAKLGFSSMEIVTPLQASLDAERVVLRARTVSLKGVRP